MNARWIQKTKQQQQQQNKKLRKTDYRTLYRRQTKETRMRTRTQTSCWSFFFVVFFWFCIMRIEPNIFQLVSRRRQRHKNTNRVWDLDLEFFWLFFSVFFFLNPSKLPEWWGQLLLSTLCCVVIVCLNIIEAGSQWVNLEFARALNEGKERRLRKHN